MKNVSKDVFKEIDAEGFSVTVVRGGSLDGIRIMVEDRLTRDRWVARGKDIDEGLRDLLASLEEKGFRPNLVAKSISQ